MKLSNNQKAVTALITANIIWGAAPPIFKWALEDIGPYNLAFWRFFIATILILPFAYKHLKINSKDFFGVFLMGFFGITINIIFFFQGLLYAPSINSAIIASSAPVFIVFFAFFFLKEKPKNKVIIGSIIGLVGVLLFLIIPFFETGSISPSIGNFLIIIATLGAIIATILGRGVVKRNHPLGVTFWTFFVGTLGFIPLLTTQTTIQNIIPNLTNNVILGIAFGAILSSLIAYLCHNYSLKYLTASDVGVFAYIDPIVTVLIAIPLLGEIPDLLFTIGAVFVFGGIFIAEGRLHYHPIHKLFKN